MNKLASKILWWQGVVLAALALVRLIAWLAGLGHELMLAGLDTAFCLAFAALSMALSRTRLCGLSPWLAVLSSLGFGFGFLIFVGYLELYGSPWVGLIGSEMAFVALAIMTGGVMDCKQEAGKRMDKPLRVASLLLATYVLARILILISFRYYADHSRQAIYEVVLLFLSAAGVMLSLSIRWWKDNTVLSSIVAAAFVVGALLFAGALSAWYIEGISAKILLKIVLGVVLLLPSFLRRYSGKG